MSQHRTEMQVAALLARIERQDDEIKHLRATLAESQARETNNRQLLLLEVENQLLKAQRQLSAASAPMISQEPETES